MGFVIPLGYVGLHDAVDRIGTLLFKDQWTGEERAFPQVHFEPPLDTEAYLREERRDTARRIMMRAFTASVRSAALEFGWQEALYGRPEPRVTKSPLPTKPVGESKRVLPPSFAVSHSRPCQDARPQEPAAPPLTDEEVAALHAVSVEWARLKPEIAAARRRLLQAREKLRQLLNASPSTPALLIDYAAGERIPVRPDTWLTSTTNLLFDTDSTGIVKHSHMRAFGRPMRSHRVAVPEALLPACESAEGEQAAASPGPDVQAADLARSQGRRHRARDVETDARTRNKIERVLAIARKKLTKMKWPGLNQMAHLVEDEGCEYGYWTIQRILAGRYPPQKELGIKGIAPGD